MANAPLDQNNRPAIICASKNNGTTIVPIQINPSTHGVMIEDAHTGSDNGNNQGNAMLDENTKPVWIALSSAGNGAIIEVYGNPTTGAILVDST